ncbi:MAG: deoxyribodipyrimidine photo-lyase [Chlamydiota bacterium]
MSVGAVWFKRDLRLSDHEPLITALREHARVILFYVFEEEYWRLPSKSFRQWSFFYDCIRSLQEEVAKRQGTVLTFTSSLEEVLMKLGREMPLTALYAHEETGEDWTYQRDIRVRDFCQKAQITFQEFPTNGVVRHLKSRDEWTAIHQRRMEKPVEAQPIDLHQTRISLDGDILPKPESFPDYFSGEKTQKGGLAEGKKVLKSFLEERGERYLKNIANPSAFMSSSRLSAFLSAGVFSIKQVFCALQKAQIEAPSVWFRKNLAAFSSRLYWRCHFIQKLEDEPELEFHAMHRGCDTLRKQDPSSEKLQAWKEGRTGYPLIDACMRCLKMHGWLPFRMRAMVMSFASYHLWIDWRDSYPILGALFTDYEPGIHILQSQMQSGVTGINAFRMYNPVKQSQDHDPKGIFIKEFVPELRALPEEAIHEPWNIPPFIRIAENILLPPLYEYPIVDHKKAIKFARQAFKELTHQPSFEEEQKRVYLKHGSRKKRTNMR